MCTYCNTATLAYKYFQQIVRNQIKTPIKYTFRTQSNLFLVYRGHHISYRLVYVPNMYQYLQYRAFQSIKRSKPFCLLCGRSSVIPFFFSFRISRTYKLTFSGRNCLDFMIVQQQVTYTHTHT